HRGARRPLPGGGADRLDRPGDERDGPRGGPPGRGRSRPARRRRPAQRAARRRRDALSFGTPHRHFRQVGSTNTVARELAEAGAPNGTVVTAEEQTAGRGRQGRSWTAPPGSALLFSAIVRPLGKRHPLLPLAVPL